MNTVTVLVAILPYVINFIIMFFCVASTCDHGDVRLYGGYRKSVGFAEVCIMGQWTSICYNSQVETTSIKLCRQLLGRENVGMTSHVLYIEDLTVLSNTRVFL